MNSSVLVAVEAPNWQVTCGFSTIWGQQPAKQLMYGPKIVRAWLRVWTLSGSEPPFRHAIDLRVLETAQKLRLEAEIHEKSLKKR